MESSREVGPSNQVLTHQWSLQRQQEEEGKEGKEGREAGEEGLENFMEVGMSRQVPAHP